MAFATPSSATVDASKRAIAKFEADAARRQQDRSRLATETGYHMLAPGRF